MVLKNKVSLMSLHQWTIGPLMINNKKISTHIDSTHTRIVSTCINSLEST